MIEKQQIKAHIRPIIGITLVSLLICGFLYPLFITGIGQVFFPSQANGEIVAINGEPVGSALIAQQFSLPIFFHSRNETAMPSASGVDPDILLDEAYAQIPRISNATGISAESLTNLVNESQEGTLWVFGTRYINVLEVNLQLIHDHPTVYGNFTD
jgi:potassium-transporting ATPase KdpC subunit